MQIIDDPTRGSISGRLGRAFGQGLAEQVPKEIERGRLSAGLKRFEQESAGKTPLQQMIDLYGIPGFTPEMGYTLTPLLKAQRGKQEAMKRGSDGSSMGVDAQPISQAQISGIQQTQPQGREGKRIPEMQLNKELKPIEKMGPEQRAQSLIRPSTQDELWSKAGNEMRKYPDRYETAQEYYNDAAEDDRRRMAIENSELEQGSRQAQLADKLEKDFNKVLSKKLQKEGSLTYKDVSGDLQNDLINQAEKAVSEGKMSIKEAVEQASDNAFNHAKSNQLLSTVGAEWFRNGKSSKNALKDLRKDFDKVDKLEEFSNKIVSKFGASDPVADSFAYPVQENKEINNYISKLPGEIRSSNVPTMHSIPNKYGKKSVSESDIADFVSKNLTDKDSLLSIALALRGKQYSDEKFIDKIRENVEKNKISLTDLQRRQLTKYQPIKMSLGDMFLFSMSGLDPIKEME